MQSNRESNRDGEVQYLLKLLREDLRIAFSTEDMKSQVDELWKILLDYYEMEVVYPTDTEEDQKLSKSAQRIHEYFHRRFEAEFIESEWRLSRVNIRRSYSR